MGGGIARKRRRAALAAAEADSDGDDAAKDGDAPDAGLRSEPAARPRPLAAKEVGSRSGSLGKASAGVRAPAGGTFEVVLRSVEKGSTEKGMRRLFVQDGPTSVTLDNASRTAVLRVPSRLQADACAARWDALKAAEGAFARRGGRGRGGGGGAWGSDRLAEVRALGAAGAPAGGAAVLPKVTPAAPAAAVASATPAAPAATAPPAAAPPAAPAASAAAPAAPAAVEGTEASAAAPAPLKTKKKTKRGASGVDAADEEGAAPAVAEAPAKKKKRKVAADAPAAADEANGTRSEPAAARSATSARTSSSAEPASAPLDEEARNARTRELTQQIHSFAKDRQMKKAIETFERMEREGLTPGVHAFATLVNAHVSSGDVAGGARTLAKMEANGLQPNVVAYTALLKGHCRVGDTARARALLDAMVAREPPVYPDAHAVTTFLRGCVRVGDVAAAQDVAAKLPAWGLKAEADPNGICRFLGLLWSQSLRLEPLTALLERLRAQQKQRERQSAGAAADSLHPPIDEPCQFWAAGRCKKGRKCRFRHDGDNGALASGALLPTRRELDRLGAQAALSLGLARAYALLGRTQECAEAWKQGCDDHRLVQEGLGLDPTDPANVDGLAAHGAAATNSWKLQLELDALRDAATQSPEDAKATPKLGECFRRAFLFDAKPPLATDGASAVASSASASSTAKPLRKKRRKAEQCIEDVANGGTSPDLANALVRSLEQSFGLDEYLRLSGGKRIPYVKHFRSCLLEDGRTLNWRAIFSSKGESRGEDLPLNLEICSGSGEWAAAQARQSVGTANWATLEIMRDRVHDTLTRMALERLQNLCVVGGDAAEVMREHVAEASVDHVFINFPEPPHVSGDDASDSSFHLLTAAFFLDLRRALRPGGRLTILSDNLRYLRTLARILAVLRPASSGRRAFEPPAAEGPAGVGEDCDGVRVHHGWPDTRHGHLVKAASYFDRLWERSDRTGRYFIFLQRGR
eukprot:TRINITY_DN23379_c0_g1_i1.p1 TRINITY_DN23379_c0_g1~~TRINITY_DN23379_c0_g1_i1.p1  ORF type:complete len:980 (-),score=272.25 TRINITY_DN23379_c0_g1_i1:145-3084(-)